VAEGLRRLELARIVGETMSPQQSTPGFAALPRERARPVALPPWFIDRCRQAFLSVSFAGPKRVLGITSALQGEG